MVREIKITSLSGRGTLFLKNGEYWSYWLDDADWGQAEGQHNTYAYYQQVGESIVSTTMRTRPLAVTGWVLEAGMPIQARCDFLNAFISPNEDYELEYNGKKIGFRPDSSVVYGRERRVNNELARRFLIQGTCPYPLFTDSEDTEIPFDQTGKLFHFPTDFGLNEPLVFGVIGKAFHIAVQNKGGFPTGVLLRMKFNGEVQNPRVKNLTTGKMLGLRRTFTRGEQLEISTVPGSKRMTLRGADGRTENLIKYRDFQTSWIQLQPGENLIALDCDDLDQRANMDVSVYFTPLYLEVE